MDQDENNFVKSNREGIDRVSKDNGNYAFLMESSSVEFIIERKCELTMVGGLLDTKGYGIALPPSKLNDNNIYCANVSFNRFITSIYLYTTFFIDRFPV